ncbi:hypothetical protein FRB94_005424 [Tulasnella sp. JGI-2019a]|nr:hypothetical protein FRB94_005424 [Tulasnella sp. JGI-2019a]KAG9001953.1 hypothetical protein FRB93_011925 [Tulasnella sp. JGI-2019a]
MSNTLPPGMETGKRYSVILNNLAQGKRVRFSTVFVPDGPKNNETWTCSISLEFKDGTEYTIPPMYTACGKSRGDALNVASYLLLASIGSA